MEFAQQYLDFLFEFHMVRDYFECHEIMETYWKSQPTFPDKKQAEVALLQLAVGLYHWRRGNYNGALYELERVQANLEYTLKDLVEVYDLSGLDLAEDISDLVYLVKTNQEYYDYNLPLNQHVLQAYCEAFELSSSWQAPSPMDDDAIIHHHLPEYRDNQRESGVKMYRFVGMDNEMFSDVLAIRKSVFSDEQGYDVKLDPDEVDQFATQFILYEDNVPQSIARLFQNEIGKYQIGRVATQADARGKGYGIQVMEAIISHCKLQRASSYIELHSQVHAIPFYEKVGFQTIGDVYLEDGEPHQSMVLEI